MNTIDIIIVGLVLLISFSPIIIFIKKAMKLKKAFENQYENVRKYNNTDEISRNVHNELFKSAKERIVIYDDGSQGMIYDDRDIVDILKSKISDDQFKVYGFFNREKDFKQTMFYKEIVEGKGYENVYIGFNDDDRPDDWHFKIIDNKSILFSRHEENEEVRECQLYENYIGRGVPKNIQISEKDFERMSNISLN